MIIRNLDISKFNDDLTIFTVYAENLVPNNQIVKIEASKLFENTFYVTFGKEFEFKNAYKRHQRRPIIRKSKIEILEAFKTDSIVGCLESRNKIDIGILDWHFTNRQKSGVSEYSSFKECEPFVIIKLRDHMKVNAVLQKKNHIIHLENFIPEIFYNPKIVPNFEALNGTNEE